MRNVISKGRGIFDKLKQDILDGKYVPGKKFPSIVQLMRRFEVSRVTAVRVTENLKKAGLIVSRQGQGTFVTRRARLLGGAIGLIVPGICYSEVFPVICQEISRLAQKSGLTLLFGDVSSPDPKVRAERAFGLANKFAKENVSGVIYQPMQRFVLCGRSRARPDDGTHALRRHRGDGLSLPDGAHRRSVPSDPRVLPQDLIGRADVDIGVKVFYKSRWSASRCAIITLNRQYLQGQKKGNATL